MITIRKIIRSLTTTMPSWLLILCSVCLAIPLVRLAALLFTAVLCLAQPARVRRAASAWKGGKSHRRFETLCSTAGADLPGRASSKPGSRRA
jgi:hypothetical protein